MDVLNRTLLAAMAVAGVTLIGGAAQAASIGFNISAANHEGYSAGYLTGAIDDTIAPATTLLPTDVAGVAAVAQGNWNNISGALDYVVPFPGSPYPNDGRQHGWPDEESAINNSLTTVVDSVGTIVTGASVNWAFNKSWWNQRMAGWGFDGATPNGRLSQGGIVGSSTITLTGIPYAAYDVYVYINGSGNPGGGTPGVVDGTGTLALASGATGAVNTTPGTYTWAQPGGQWIQGTNLMVIPGNTASGFSLTRTSTNGTGLVGLQVVAVPEPTSLGLLGLGSLALLGRRRARKA